MTYTSSSASMSPNYSRTINLICDRLGIERPQAEFRFHPVRKFRFDYAWPSRRLYVEIEGGIWVRGRHVRPATYEVDCEKYNLATLMGWRGFRFTPAMLKDGRALRTLADYFRAERLKED